MDFEKENLMLKIIVLALMLMLSSCFSKRIAVDEMQYFGPKQLNGHFENIHISGPFDVKLTTLNNYSKAIVTADERALPYIHLKIKNHTLYVDCTKACDNYQRPMLHINVQKLRNFYFAGAGNIIGHNLLLHNSYVYIKNKNVTKLDGHLKLREIYLAGNGYTSLIGVYATRLRLKLKNHARLKIQGKVQLASMSLGTGTWISLYWLTADQLEIKGQGSTFIQLAGIVHVLNVELWNKARFNGRYLRAQETFIKTHDHSLAEISTFGHQHTLASGASDIYYYNDDFKAHTDLMGKSGAVLDMNQWEPDDVGDNLLTNIQTSR